MCLKVFKSRKWARGCIRCTRGYLLEHNSYKNCSIDMTFYKDKLQQLDCVHTKFQFSRSSGTSLVCCRIL